MKILKSQKINSKIEYNRRAIDKRVQIISFGERGKIVDVKDENTFLILVNKEIKEVDIFDVRYI